MARAMLWNKPEVLMLYRLLFPLLLGAATLAGGCAGTSGYATYSVTATIPELVYVAPGVYAVAGYGQPIFYAGNSYWRYYDGGWYRSNRYTGGWYREPRPPVVVMRIERPTAYYYRDRGRIHVDYRDRDRARDRRVIRESRDRD